MDLVIVVMSIGMSERSNSCFISERSAKSCPGRLNTNDQESDNPTSSARDRKVTKLRSDTSGVSKSNSLTSHKRRRRYTLINQDHEVIRGLKVMQLPSISI